MKKKDLKAGMVVQTRKGERYVVLDETINNMDRYFPLCYYNEDLKYRNGLSEWDVVKVFTSDFSSIPEMLDNKHQLSPIWEREEDDRKEVPSQLEYLKGLWNMFFDENDIPKTICANIKCNNCPCNYKSGCHQGDIRDILVTINREWKLEK